MLLIQRNWFVNHLSWLIRQSNHRFINPENVPVNVAWKHKILLLNPKWFAQQKLETGLFASLEVVHLQTTTIALSIPETVPKLVSIRLQI
jgi:hypothetical protein